MDSYDLLNHYFVLCDVVYGWFAAILHVAFCKHTDGLIKLFTQDICTASYNFGLKKQIYFGLSLRFADASVVYLEARSPELLTDVFQP